MADVFTKEKRSWIMSRIKGKETKMEKFLESKMIENKINFEKHPKIFGNPDFLIEDKKIVIFVDGCFWHKCPKCYKSPKSRKKFWTSKIEGNVKRDMKVTNELKRNGYKVIRVWEHELEKQPDKCIKKMYKKVVGN